MSIFAVLGFSAIIVLLLVVGLYNNLVRRRNMAEEAWSGIDVQLKRRSDLIPNLIETVKGYMGHERDVLEHVAASRSAAAGATTQDQRVVAEGVLSGALGRLFAVAENYPDLKANQGFAELQKNLSEIEDQLQMARRYYNGTVRDLNTSMQIFPANMIARELGFAPMAFFEIENQADKDVPKVSF